MDAKMGGYCSMHEGNEMGGAWWMHEEVRNAYKNVAGKPDYPLKFWKVGEQFIRRNYIFDVDLS